MMNPTTRRPGDALASSFDTIFARMLAPMGSTATPNGTTPVWEAPVDLWETDSAYHAALLIPGLATDSIQVTIEDSQVTVAAERKPLTIEGAKVLWTDFGPATYRRTFRFGSTLDASKAEATYQDGVLRLVLPKSPEAQPRRIAVNVAGAAAS